MVFRESQSNDSALDRCVAVLRIEQGAQRGERRAGRTCTVLVSVAVADECLPPNPSTLAQLIESERVELLQVQAMLKCLYEVLLYADDDDSLMHADVANVCARLINDSACRLGKLLMEGAERSSSDESSQSELSKSCGSEE
jgi:hypothetical protein